MALAAAWNIQQVLMLAVGCNAVTYYHCSKGFESVLQQLLEASWEQGTQQGHGGIL